MHSPPPFSFYLLSSSFVRTLNTLRRTSEGEDKKVEARAVKGMRVCVWVLFFGGGELCVCVSVSVSVLGGGMVCLYTHKHKHTCICGYGYAHPPSLYPSTILTGGVKDVLVNGSVGECAKARAAGLVVHVCGPKIVKV
jgi:hypothetical protein